MRYRVKQNNFMTVLGNCDFEKGLCQWANAQSGDDFDWTQGSGTTTSSGTGPRTDHTLGTARGIKICLYSE